MPSHRPAPPRTLGGGCALGVQPAVDRVMSEQRIVFQPERVSGWGMAVGGPAQVARPTTPEQVGAAMALVAMERGSLAMRGAGCSYGDASVNTAGHVLDTS